MTSLVYLSLLSLLAPGMRLPELKGEFLTGRKALLPQECRGKVAVLILGFTYESRHPTEEWAKRLTKDFGKNPEVIAYSIPVLGSGARIGKFFIDSGMRRGTPKQDHEKVITIWSNAEEWKQHAGFASGRENDSYLVLLNQSGNVEWIHHGMFDVQIYEGLKKKVAELLKSPPLAAPQNGRR